MRGVLSISMLGYLVVACGGATRDDELTGTGAKSGAGGGGTGGLATGGAGTGGVGTGGIGTGGGGTGGGGTGGIGTGGIGTGGIGTGGIGTGGIGTGGIGTGGVGGVAAVCSGLCQEIAAAKCPAEDPYSACFAGCQLDWPSYQAQCGPQIDAYAQCVLGPGKVVCNWDGQSKVQGCDAQLVEWVKCGGCIPTTDDDPCDACTKKQCCAELTKLYNHPALPGLLACVNNCSSEACADGCWSQYPTLWQAVQPYTQCQGQKCSAC